MGSLTQIGEGAKAGALAGAVVVVEHDLGLLTSVSQHMWAMVEGRLAYSGDVAAFRSSPVFASLRGIEQG